MLRFRMPFFTYVAAVLLLLCSSAAVGFLARREVHVSTLYVDGGGIASNGVDCFVPSSKERLPAVIFLHWGGWDGGDKAFHIPDCRRIAAHGIAAFSINYTLATQSQPSYPQALNDIAKAVAWVKSRPYVNPNRVGLVGYSAGGHLALLYAYSHADIRAVASISGPFDLTKHPGLEGKVRNFLGCDSASGKGTWEQASPASLIRPGLPMTLIVAGGSDALVEVPDLEQGALALRESGNKVSYLVMQRANHCLINMPELRDMTLDAFLQESLS